jgi:glycine/D-amino acid oxidase-like deaminating enzyme
VRADVVVIGGGVAGASAAFHLATGGVDVVLLERGSVGGGATAAAVGVLSPPLRQPFHETVHFRGRAEAVRLWRFAEASVQGLAKLLRDRGYAEEAGLDLSGGYVLAEPHTNHEVKLAYAALAEGGFDVAWITPDDVQELCGGRGFAGGYRIEGGGSLDPGATTVALMRAAESAGARIIEDVDVIGTKVDVAGVVCRADGAEIQCDAVVHATHIDSGKFSDFLRDEIVPIRGQGFSSAPLPESFPGCFSTHWKLNLWRQNSAGRVIMSGWRHDAWNRAYGKNEAALDEHLQGDIRRWFDSYFPASAPLEVKDRWSGVFGWTADFLPMVGAIPGSPREYVISAFGGAGVSFAFECGRGLAHDLIGRTPVPGCEIFSPARFSSV